MKIIHCRKGGRVPEGYCRWSCLNYREDHVKDPSRCRSQGEILPPPDMAFFPLTAEKQEGANCALTGAFFP